MAQTNNFIRHEPQYDTWSVLFSNKQARSKSEVDALFSKFGSIKTVIQTGSSTGLCIVKFGSEEGAQNCVRTRAPDRGSIFLTPWRERSEQSSAAAGSNSAQRKAAVNATSDETNGFNDDPDTKTSKNQDINPNPTPSTPQIHSNKLGANSAVSPGSNPPTDQKSPTPNAPNSPKDQNTSPTTQKDSNSPKYSKHQIPPRKPNLKEENSPNSQNSNSDFGKLKPKVASAKSSSSLALRLARARQIGTPVAKSPHESAPEAANGGPPELIEKKLTRATNYVWPDCKGPCCRGNQEPEVIVANLDDKCDMEAVRKLFEALEPTFISRIAMHAMAFRYCHVYFKNQEQAKSAERIHDRMNFFGKSLIVLTPESIIAQA